MNSFVPIVAGLLFYVVYLAIYRLYFHPLARFPGPKIAALTKLYEAYYDLIKRPGGQYMNKINRMHDRYGPIVRVNPDEVHIKDSGYLNYLYCTPAGGKRDKYAPSAYMTGTPDAIFGTVDHDTHRRRRAAISPFFARSVVTNAEPHIFEKAKALCDTVQTQIARQGWAEMRVNFLAYATDTVWEHAFADVKLGLMKSEQHAKLWKDAVYAIAVLTPWIKQFPWLLPLALRLPLRPLYMVLPMIARIVELRRDLDKQATLAVQKLPASVKNEEKKEGLHDLFESILTSKSILDSDKQSQRVAQEGFVVIVAAGETTARMLTTATFHILANKDTVLPKLQQELIEAIPDPSIRVSLLTLEKLPWLTAIIKESLRITGLVTSRLPLVSPDRTLTYQEWTIPPGTPISMTLRDILLDETAFESPHEFRPERWLHASPEMEHAWVPFGRGSRMCVGLNFAMAELYLALAYLIRTLDLELYETTREKDIDIIRDCFIGEVAASSKGVRVTFA